jgi:hypothetical protein
MQARATEEAVYAQELSEPPLQEADAAAETARVQYTGSVPVIP